MNSILILLIDLDTVICQDISYVNDLPNIFIEIGGTCLRKIYYFLIIHL